MKWRDARKSHPEQESSSVPKVKTQTDVKSLNSLKASPATKAQNPMSMVGKMKKIVVWFSKSSRMSWLQVWKQKHLWLSLLISTCWRWKETQREFEKEGTQWITFMRRKKGPRLCISKIRSNEFCSTESWRIGIERSFGTRHEILRMHLVQN